MADPVRLLFELEAKATGIKELPDEARAALGKLRTVFQSQLGDLQVRGFELLGTQIEHIADEIPVVGPLVSNLASKVLELGKHSEGIKDLSADIIKIGQASGKSNIEVFNFLSSIKQIKDDAEKSDSILTFLGSNLANNLLPTLSEAAATSKQFGDEVLAAAKATGKSDDEIDQFTQSLTTSTTKADALGKMVSFLGKETAAKLTPAMEAASASIEKIAAVSNLPVDAITSFVASFSKLGTEQEKAAAAAGFFGEAVAQKVTPELVSASKAMGTASAEGSLFALQLGAIVEAIGPVGIAIIGLIVQLAVMTVGFIAAVEAGRKLTETFFGLAESASEFRAHIKDLSLQTGLSVEFLSGMELAIRSVGGTLDGLVASVLQFQTKMEQAKEPTSDIAAVFRQLNVDSDDLETALKQTFTGLAAIDNVSTQTALAMQLFGRSAKQLLALLKESGGDIDAVIKKARELGLVISEEDAEAASKFEAAMAAVQLQFRALSSAEVLPAATAVLTFFSKELVDNRDKINTIIDAISLLAKAFSIVLIGAIRAATGFIRLFALELNLLGRLFPNTSTAINLLAAALGLLGNKVSDVSEAEKKAAAEAESVKKAHEAARLEADKRVKSGEQEIKFLQSLLDHTELSADENNRLEDSYKSLDETAANRIKSIQDETAKIKALIDVKKEQLDTDKLLAATDRRRQQIILDEINDNKRLEASRDSINAVELQSSKELQEQAARNFQQGRINRETKLAEDEAAAKRERDITIRGLEDKRTAALKELQLILLTNKQKAVKTPQDKEKETAKAAEITKINEQIILADKTLNETRTKLNDQYRADELQAERQHRENLIGLVQQTAQDRVAAIRDTLASGDDVRRQVQEREINETKLFEKRKSKEILQEQINQSVTMRGVLLQLQEDFNAQEFRLAQEASEKRINLLVKLGTSEALLAEDRIKVEEQTAIRERRANLQRLLNETVVISERKQINDKLAALDIEETELRRQQSLRRQQIIRNERDAVAGLLIQNANDRLQAIEQIENRATEQAKRQAALRIISEENAANKIIESRRRLLDAQQILIEAEQAAAKTIDDPLQRANREQELLNALRALQRARVQLEADTTDLLQDARDKDLNNERQYQDELQRLQTRSRSALRDAARSIIDNFVNTEQRRRAIIRAQIQLDIDELGDRNEAERDSTQREISIKAERLRFLEQHLSTLRTLRQTEGDDFRDANAERDQLLAQLELLHEKQEAEETRHVIVMSAALRMLHSGEFTRREILNQIDLEKGIEEIRHKNKIEALKKRKEELEKKIELDNKELEELKRINKEIEKENERHRQVTEQQKGVEKVAKTPDFIGGIFEGIGDSPIKKQGDALKELGKISGEVFRGMANAIGSLVQQWVLYGSTGPGALKKVLAAALAAFASQAAVAALMELAYGFAALTPYGALVYGPAALHFKAAALFGAAAAIAGVAGRAVAGNAFNQSAQGGGAGGGERTGTGELNPIVLGRNQPQRPQQQVVRHEHVLRVESNDSHIVSVIGRNWRESGELRELVFEDT